MATNPLKGDGHRNGAVRSRSQGIDKLTYVGMNISDTQSSMAPQQISRTQKLAFETSDSSLLIPNDDQD